MRFPTGRHALALTLTAALLGASTVEARFVLTDVDFDDLEAGDELGRRGAMFDEPVEGPPFLPIERIVDQGGGDLAVTIFDLADDASSELYWDFHDGVEPTGGLLTARVEIRPAEMGDVTVGLRAGDLATSLVEFTMVQDGPATYQLTWTDADSPRPTVFGAASLGTTLPLRFEVDLDAGRWSLWIDDRLEVADESVPVLEPFAVLATGHPAGDGGLEGAVEIDLVQVDWRPDASVPHVLIADFDDREVGEPLQTRGPEFGEPVFLNGTVVPTVERAPSNGSRAMEQRQGENPFSGSIWQFEGAVEVDDGPVSVSFTYYASEILGSVIRFPPRTEAAVVLLTLRFDLTGQLTLADAADPLYASIPYEARRTYRFEMSFDPVRDVYSVWIDGERVVHERAHGIATRDLGWITFRHEIGSPVGSMFQVDDLVVRTLGGVPTHASPAPLATTTLEAAPNPFNPVTEIRFELPRAGRVSLEVIDVRGRRVRRLADGHHAAGPHSIRWTGRDERGRALASGVYWLRLRSADGTTSRAVTLVQ